MTKIGLALSKMINIEEIFINVSSNPIKSSGINEILTAIENMKKLKVIALDFEYLYYKICNNLCIRETKCDGKILLKKAFKNKFYL